MTLSVSWLPWLPWQRYKYSCVTEFENSLNAGMTARSSPTQDMVHPENHEKNTEKEDMKGSPVQLSPEPPLAVNGSSSSTALSANVMPCQATSVLTHELVLQNEYTAKLLYLLGEFLCLRCRKVRGLTPWVSVSWLRTVDMLLVTYKSQSKPFLCPGSVVFLYMLCRDSVSADVARRRKLCTELLICFYISCSYIGNEISYWARYFMSGISRQAFSKRTLEITMRMSHKMLQINTSPQFFAQVLADLKNRTYMEPHQGQKFCQFETKN
ncbi:cyclin-dependent kinase 5 activator 1-like [Astyanax mexicanus]|uniref:cyclin-dependent kinase 5 activator 1-like n=1 Tax=Astyanax mexicanus TaxID=7994 RepID=UPI0020CAF014|nr:cyclin-dependent kinase 5 activator 1-like [Astyanax mexicanus]